jgi:hypothetical protein
MEDDEKDMLTSQIKDSINKNPKCDPYKNDMIFKDVKSKVDLPNLN